jgi:putative ABC transport system permease protein
MNLAARVRGDPATIVPQVRAALRTVDADVALSAVLSVVQSMDSILRDSVSSARFRTQLLMAFAGVALLLAVIGLYGMLAYSVAQRSREMGIRIALGARPTVVFRMVLREGMLLVVVGVLLGVGGALAATRLLTSQLYNVGATDPGVFSGVAITLLLAGLAAGVIPARRATRADPVPALRLEQHVGDRQQGIGNRWG